MPGLLGRCSTCSGTFAAPSEPRSGYVESSQPVAALWDSVTASTGVRDPRAELLGKVADEMAGAVLHDRALFDLARDVETTVLRVLEEVKPGRNLRTNVEFYTALVLQSIELQPPMFVAMFACGRSAGWCAHVIEQHSEDHLIRPQSEYIGVRGRTVQR
jgi:citrate synthase